MAAYATHMNCEARLRQAAAVVVPAHAGGAMQEGGNHGGKRLAYRCALGVGHAEHRVEQLLCGSAMGEWLLGRVAHVKSGGTDHVHLIERR